MEEPPWSMRVAARKERILIQFLITLKVAFVLMVILETSSGLARVVRDAQVGYLVLKLPKRTCLFSCAGKADSHEPRRTKILDVGMVLVPTTLEK